MNSSVRISPIVGVGIGFLKVFSFFRVFLSLLATLSVSMSAPIAFDH